MKQQNKDQLFFLSLYTQEHTHFHPLKKYSLPLLTLLFKQLNSATECHKKSQFAQPLVLDHRGANDNKMPSDGEGRCD